MFINERESMHVCVINQYTHKIIHIVYNKDITHGQWSRINGLGITLNITAIKNTNSDQHMATQLYLHVGLMFHYSPPSTVYNTLQHLYLSLS